MTRRDFVKSLVVGAVGAAFGFWGRRPRALPAFNAQAVRDAILRAMPAGTQVIMSRHMEFDNNAMIMRVYYNVPDGMQFAGVCRTADLYLEPESAYARSPEVVAQHMRMCYENDLIDIREGLVPPPPRVRVWDRVLSREEAEAVCREEMALM